MLPNIERSPDGVMKIYTKVLIGMIAGVAVGIAGNLAHGYRLVTLFSLLDLYGRIFIKLITMIVIPIVVASLIVGIASLADLRKLGRIAAKTFFYFTAMTAIAATWGVLAGLTIRPGAGFPANARDESMKRSAAAQTGSVSAPANLTETLVDIIPANPVDAAAKSDMLGLIFFTLVFAAATGKLREARRRAILEFFESVNDAAMVVLSWVIRLAPTAVFALIASMVARFGAGLLRNMALFILAVIVGLLVHSIVTYGLALRFLVGMNPLSFFRRIIDVPLMAFSTSSSSAVLPVSLAVAEKDLGISSAVSGFVLPLGTSANKSGSAVFKSVAVILVAEVFGVHLGTSGLVLLILGSTLSSMATAGVAGYGMVSIIVVFQIVGLGSLAPAGIALVIGIDRINDMLRTAVNVTGTMVCAACIARSEGETLTPAAPTRT